MQDEMPLQGQTFVFTGELSLDREEAQSKVSMLGGRVTTQVSGKTTFLVAGTDPGPSKLKKAETLNITILTEDDFLKLIKKSSKNFDDTVKVDIETKVEPVNEKVRNEAWCEKYRPLIAEDLVGNLPIVEQLRDFLKNKTKFKAALLSGQPGVGKTTAVQIIAKELKYDLVEFNASDTRNKSEIVSSIRNTLNTYSLTKSIQKKKKILVMDEIDGMTSDRGGIPELINLIKNTKIPILCICNDRNNPKIRTLANYCLDLRYRKLESRQILPRIKYVLECEGKQMKDSMITEIINHSHGDLRHCLNTLQNLVLRKTINYEQISSILKKNIAKNIFEIASEIFGRKKIYEKMDLYFEDYSMIPLFVQENYIKTNFKNIFEIKTSAESISFSDIIDKHIHGYNQEWGLLPCHAFFSSVNPLHGKILQKRLDFPVFLGQLSKKNKHLRNLCETLTHCHKIVHCNKYEFRMFTVDLLFHKYVNFLLQEDIQNALNILIEYDFIKNDMDNIAEYIFGGVDYYKTVPTKVKTALTKAYKKLSRKLSYNVEESKESIKDEEIDIE
ncbi:DNA replication factor C complex subunit Rfc1 [Conglomerata obtusa]